MQIQRDPLGWVAAAPFGMGSWNASPKGSLGAAAPFGMGSGRGFSWHRRHLRRHSHPLAQPGASGIAPGTEIRAGALILGCATENLKVALSAGVRLPPAPGIFPFMWEVSGWLLASCQGSAGVPVPSSIPGIAAPWVSPKECAGRGLGMSRASPARPGRSAPLFHSLEKSWRGWSAGNSACRGSPAASHQTGKYGAIPKCVRSGNARQPRAGRGWIPAPWGASKGPGCVRDSSRDSQGWELRQGQLRRGSFGTDGRNVSLSSRWECHSNPAGFPPSTPQRGSESSWIRAPLAQGEIMECCRGGNSWVGQSKAHPRALWSHRGPARPCWGFPEPFWGILDGKGRGRL